MRLLVISGRLGAGKTTILRALSNDYAVTVPMTTTTRSVSPTDVSLLHCERDEFIRRVQSAELHMPMISGGHIYAWSTDQFNLLREGDRLAVSTRPYTALALESLVPGTLAVWLDVDEPTRLTRLSAREELRDIDDRGSRARTTFDIEDAAYSDLFTTHISASPHLAAELAQRYDN